MNTYTHHRRSSYARILYRTDFPLRWLVIGTLFLLLQSCQAARANPAALNSDLAPAAKTEATVLSTPENPVEPTVPATAFPSPSPTNPHSATFSARPSHTPALTATPAEPITTTLLFTGVIVPARCVQAALDAKGNPDYPYEEVRDILSKTDLSVGVFNATMSDRVERTGCIWTWQLVGAPSNADAAARAGFDLMSVATNHIKDCGIMKSWCDYAFFDTLDNLQRAGIQTVGGGKNLAEALQPVVFTLNGVRFGFVSLGDSKMDLSVFASEDHPGIAQLIPENISTALKQARQAADVVIALPHWGSEDVPVPNWLQTEQARQLVAAGADLVVGNHTHVVQAIQEIEGVPVFYGLGNFVFDQGLRDHRQGIILIVKFKGTKYIGYELIPTHTDADGRIHVAGIEEAAEILEGIARSSQLVR